MAKIIRINLSNWDLTEKREAVNSTVNLIVEREKEREPPGPLAGCISVCQDSLEIVDEAMGRRRGSVLSPELDAAEGDRDRTYVAFDHIITGYSMLPELPEVHQAALTIKANLPPDLSFVSGGSSAETAILEQTYKKLDLNASEALKKDNFGAILEVNKGHHGRFEGLLRSREGESAARMALADRVMAREAIDLAMNKVITDISAVYAKASAEDKALCDSILTLIKERDASARGRATKEKKAKEKAKKEEAEAAALAAVGAMAEEYGGSTDGEVP